MGTIILLLGVLALSWRLNNDPTTRPPVSQNPLTPGMGFVDDDSDCEAEANTLTSEAAEEAQFANGKGSPTSYHKSNGASLPTDLPMPTTKNNDLLNITRLRRKGSTESEEIWEELEDDTLAELSPFSRRRTSVQTTPSSRPKSQGTPMDEIPDEETSLLRSGTGRSYRDKRRRRSTASINTQERERRRRSASSQDALGGWWKMKRWFSGTQSKDKGKGPEDGNGNGNGNGASVP